jgi:hypothetical protein
VARWDAALQQFDGGLPGDRFPVEAGGDPALLDGAIERLVEAAGVRKAAPAIEPNVDTALHVTADGRPALLFVGTRSDRPITATVALGEAAQVEDVLDGTTYAGATLAIPLPAYGVRMLRFA